LTIIGLELSDAGILAAAGSPPELLVLDGDRRESPGYAFVNGREVAVANSAKEVSRRHPNRSTNRFWDQLDTTPWKRGTDTSITRAEIAFRHLTAIWDRIKEFGQGVMIAVPPLYSRKQLGLLLGMTRELKMPVKGFISLPVAAYAELRPERRIFHLDIHLHRLTVTLLSQRDQLFQADFLDRQGAGLDSVYTVWVQTIADLFVRRTRFDPLHDAVSEQALFNRLPDIMTGLAHRSEMNLTLEAGGKSRHTTVARSSLWPQIKMLKRHLDEMVSEIEMLSGRPGHPLTLVVSHRLARLPGMVEALNGGADMEIVQLQPGAGALGAATLGGSVVQTENGTGVALITSRAFDDTRPPSKPKPERREGSVEQPTHLLYRHRAYPISREPLTIGRGIESRQKEIRIEGAVNGVSRRHCTIRRGDDGVLLDDYSTYGTFVDGNRVSGAVPLKAGQQIRLGEPGETFELIVVVGGDET
jgi:FHA domain